MEREKIRFASGSSECAAWHYPGTNGGCVVMTGGFAVTKEPGTDRFAQRFSDAGFTVLAFDHRHLGESGGQPRQVQRVGEQLADWRAAIARARDLPGVNPARIAIWSFSACGGQVFQVAAAHPELAAAIAQTPNADGLAAARNAGRYQRPLAMARFAGRGIADAARRAGRPAAATGAADRRAGNRRAAHDTGCPGRQPGARPGRAVLRVATGDRRPFGPPGWLLPAGAVRGPGALPAAGPGLRSGPVGAGRARRPRGGARSARRAGPAARRALHAVPRRATRRPWRPSCPSCAGTCSGSRMPSPPSWRGRQAGGHEAGGAVGRDDRVPGHRR